MKEAMTLKHSIQDENLCLKNVYECSSNACELAKKRS